MVFRLLDLAAGSSIVADGKQLLHESSSTLLLRADLDHGTLLHIRLVLLWLSLDDLRLVGELRSEGLGNTQSVEVAGFSLNLAVLTVLELRSGEALVTTDFTRETHGLPSDKVCDWVVEAVGLDRVPGAKEDDITEEDLVFKGGSEVAVGLGQGALDLTADAGDGLDGGAFEFCNFQRRVEHVLDEGGVLEDLVGCTGELELLDDLGGFVDGQDRAGGGDAEARVGGGEGVEADEAAVGGDEGRVDGAEAVHVFGGILEHAVARARVGDGVDGERLEAAPAQREDEGVVGLEDLLVPAVALDADLDESPAVFGGVEPSYDNGQLGVELVDELGGDAVEDNLGVLAGSVTFYGGSLALVKRREFLLVDVKLFLDHGLLGVVPVVFAEFLYVAAVFAGVGFVVEETVTVFFLETLLEFLFAAGVLFPLGFDFFGCLLLRCLCGLFGVFEIFEDTIAFVVLVVFAEAVKLIV